MTREQLVAKIDEAITNFTFVGSLKSCNIYGNGHINDTFLAVFEENNTLHKYILQRVNQLVFKNPDEVIENIANVTSFLRDKIDKNSGDKDRETLNLIKTKAGKNYFVDSIGSWWRAFLFIDNAISLEQAENPENLYESGLAFGRFQSMLSDYPVETLHETIADFHNTPKRYQRLQQVYKENLLARNSFVENEIKFVSQRVNLIDQLIRLKEQGEIKTRVTHNDTKINNVMLDKNTMKALSVIDLDTVMPGLSAYDFGDSIRTCGSSASEDEKDLSKVTLNMNFYKAFTEGFLIGCDQKLSKREIETLPIGAKLMTLECGIRFLTDFLEGDVYFKIHRDNQNLDRAKVQFKLVEELEKHESEINSFIQSLI